MHITLTRAALAIGSAVLISLYGCGGGSTAAITAPPAAVVPPAATTDVSVTVVDGAIQNATVCLDKNSNGVCDAGEPSGKTDATGKLTLKVDVADAGKFPILAVVGTDAVDVDNGPVTQAFTMTAPADKPAVVSPLTTLVQTLIASSGVTSAQAEASVKAQTNINVSLFDDFTKNSTDEGKAAGVVARMVVVTTQEQAKIISSTAGSTALDNTVITKADLDRMIQNKLLEILPDLLAALSSPSVQAATTTVAREEAYRAQALALVISPSTGLTTASVATLVAINNQVASSSPVGTFTPAAGANLRELKFTSATNSSHRVFVSTLAQATPDAAGMTKSVQRRYIKSGSETAAWTTIGGIPSRQSDVHFNGTAWVNCALNTEDLSSVRDAKGNSTFNTCDNFENGVSNRGASFGIGDRTMIDVYNQVNAAGYSNIFINNASSVLGTATFPTGSRLSYVSSVVGTTSFVHRAGIDGFAVQTIKAITDGGIASTQPSGTGCNTSNAGETQSTSLEGMMTSRTGTPCIYPKGQFTYSGATYISPDTNDEIWGNTTLGVGTIGVAPTGTGTAPGYYSGNTRLRVAFIGSGSNPVTYYSCKEHFVKGAPRNCIAIGTGSYSITTKGDARVLSFNNLPLIFATGLTYKPAVVERGGKVYSGYQNNPGTFNSARLDLAATNALFAKIGLPAVEISPPLTLTRTSYAGQWELVDTAYPLEKTILKLSNDGTTTCQDLQNNVPGLAYDCVLTFTNLTTGAFTLTDTNGTSVSTATGILDFLTGAASGNYFSTNPVASGSFTGFRR